jgi:mycothiol system anti-sigma-R factor
MSFLDRLWALLRGMSNGDDQAPHPDMATCHEALAVIYEFLDGELDGMSQERVQAHFEICKLCYPRLKFEESFKIAVRRAARGEAPPERLKGDLLEVLARAERGEEL